MGLNIKKLASNLTRLEVNTILKEDLICSTPKSNRHMLFELAQNYRDRLYKINGQLSGVGSNQEELVFHAEKGGEASFKAIHEAAHNQIKQLATALQRVKTDEQRLQLKTELRMVERINKQTELVLDVFRNLKARRQTEDTSTWNNEIPFGELDKAAELELNPGDLTTIRKAHEIGTQQVLMQTVVQIDGDITSYLTPAYTGMTAKEQDVLLEVHNTAFGTSIKVWRYLFETLSSLVSGAIGRALGGKKKEQKALKE